MHKTILFGASKLGTLAYEYLKDRYDICYYCDNAINKIGRIFNGLEVISVEMLIDLVTNQDYSVIITSQYYKEISTQLISQGIGEKDFKIFYNSLEYLQTLCDIEDKKDDMKSLGNYSDAKYNKDIFSKYNVHLMMDNIFTKTFIETINEEYDSKSNLFIIYNHGEKVKYADVGMYENVEILDLNDYSIYSKLYTYIYGCKKLFIHFLSDDVCEMLDRFEISKLSCTTHWVLWGADLYSYIGFNMYEDKTYEFVKDKEYYINAQRYREDLKKLGVRRKVIKDIDHILALTEGDYQLAINNFDTNAKKIDFCYSLNIDLDELDQIMEINDLTFKKKHGFETLILLGNSATWENNHIDIFYKLKDLNLQDYGLVLPLSYGNKFYAKDIVKEGKKILGDRLLVLEEFLNPYEYYNIINQVDLVIMNHVRQQGIGNINASIYLNKQVFLNAKSNVYEYYSKNNFEVNKINDLSKKKLIQKRSLVDKGKHESFKSKLRCEYSEILG